MVTIQSTNQRSEWGKDHNVNFGSGDVLAFRPLPFQQPNPVLFFSSGYWTVNQNSASARIVLGWQPGVTFKLSGLTEIHTTFE